MMAIAVQENQGFQHGLGALYELTAVGDTQKLVMVGSNKYQYRSVSI